MATLNDALFNTVFGRKADLLAALAGITPAVTTVADVLAYDGCRLTTQPPDAATMTTLLTATAAVKATITDDVHGRTALGHLLRAVVPTTNGAAVPASTAARSKEAKEALFGKQRYDDISIKMSSRVKPTDRVNGTKVQRLHDDLARGTMSADCYVLTGLTALLASDAEGRATVAGLEVPVLTDAIIPLDRNGQVLLQIYRCTRLWLAAGYVKRTGCVGRGDLAPGATGSAGAAG